MHSLFFSEDQPSLTVINRLMIETHILSFTLRHSYFCIPVCFLRIALLKTPQGIRDIVSSLTANHLALNPRELEASWLPSAYICLSASIISTKLRECILMKSLEVSTISKHQRELKNELERKLFINQ